MSAEIINIFSNFSYVMAKLEQIFCSQNQTCFIYFTESVYSENPLQSDTQQYK